MTFIALTVTASSVEGSHTDMPLLVTPSDITGLGAITLAEAQSSRFYSDEAKTTELAREVVTADEIHVKVPSVTTSTVIYMDYDGVRSDYAVTDTFGRNATWSGYEFVWHATDNVDATGNFTFNTFNSFGTVSGTGQVGDGKSITPNQYAELTGSDDQPTTNLTISAWASTTATGNHAILGKYAFGGDDGYALDMNVGNSRFFALATTFTSANSTSTINGGSLRYLKGTWGSSELKNYVDGTLEATVSTAYSSIAYDTARPLTIGRRPGSGSVYWNGVLDEIRMSYDTHTAEWTTTEYNNQNDNASFWTASGVSNFNNFTGFAGL